MRPLIIIPTYNERSSLPLTVEQVRGGAADVDVLVVDDSSPDGTGEVAAGIAARDARVHVLHRPEKQGLGPAYIAGFHWAMRAGYEIVGELDADLSHDPKDLPRLLDAAERADLVIGSRYVGGVRVVDWPLRRLLLSAAGNWYARMMTGAPFADATAGYRILRTAMLRSIGLEHVQSDGYAFQVEVAVRAHRAGFRVVEVPVVFTERRVGQSKMSRRIVWEAAWRVAKLAFDGRRRPPPAPHPHSISAAG